MKIYKVYWPKFEKEYKTNFTDLNFRFSKQLNNENNTNNVRIANIEKLKLGGLNPKPKIGDRILSIIIMLLVIKTNQIIHDTQEIINNKNIFFLKNGIVLIGDSNIPK